MGFDYDFQLINESDYLLVFDANTTNRFFMNFYKKVIIRLKRMKGITVKGDIEGIDKFSIKAIFPPYLNVINTFIQKHINQVIKTVKKDGINVISNVIDDVIFIKSSDGEKWDIKLYVIGQYTDERCKD